MKINMSQENTTMIDEFECDLCSETFDSVSALEEHKQEYHQRPSHQSLTENWDVQRDIGAAGLPGAPQV
jgi:hypothetical protein